MSPYPIWECWLARRITRQPKDLKGWSPRVAESGIILERLQARRVLTKVEFHFAALFRRAGFILTNLSARNPAAARS